MHETRVQLRWGDFDALGHLTHVAYPVILDEGRDAFFRGTVGRPRCLRRRFSHAPRLRRPWGPRNDAGRDVLKTCDGRRLRTASV